MKKNYVLATLLLVVTMLARPGHATAQFISVMTPTYGVTLRPGDTVHSRWQQFGDTARSVELLDLRDSFVGSLTVSMLENGCDFIMPSSIGTRRLDGNSVYELIVHGRTTSTVSAPFTINRDSGLVAAFRASQNVVCKSGIVSWLNLTTYSGDTADLIYQWYFQGATPTPMWEEILLRLITE